MTPNDAVSAGGGLNPRERCVGRKGEPAGERFLGMVDDLRGLLADCRDGLPASVDAAFRILAECLEQGGCILVCGNGGSAADSQHFAAELVGRFICERQALPSVSLTTDTSVLTALANDYGVEHMFARQVDALGREGDALVVLSTSGQSPNILAAADMANSKGMRVVALVGSRAEGLQNRSAVCISVPSVNTPRIQEVHGLILHALADALECALCHDDSIEREGKV
jgi:phosphoheptose isomerase